MHLLLVLPVALPVLVAVLCLVTPRQVQQAATMIAGAAACGCALALMPAAAHGTVASWGFLRADAVSVVFLLATAFLYLVTSIYSIGYFAHQAATARAGGSATTALWKRYSRHFSIGFNLFAWSMLCAPLVNGLALLWIAIEVTTVVSALLVAIDNTDGAAEAAWKYVLIASSGLGIALLSTIVLYYAGAQVLGVSYDLAFQPLLKVAHELPRTPVQLAFGLAVVGYGTKMGLFPVHTWLPDAHAEAPTPVSALLSGALLATSFYAIVRYYQIAVAALGLHFPQAMMAVFGALSLLLAALYLFDQHNIKRMLAYSSIEHMGLLAIGLSFGGLLAFAGVLLHVLCHAAAKGAAFMGAGVLVEKYDTLDIRCIRGALSTLPWTGPLFLLSIFALCATPPFGIFRSEFMIISGGLTRGHTLPTVLLVALVTFAFFGLTIATTRMLSAPAPTGLTVVTAGEVSPWTVAPVLIAVVALGVLGVHPPGILVTLLTTGATELQGGVL